MRKLLFCACFLVHVLPLLAQSFIPLWPAGEKPNFNGQEVTDTIYNDRIWRVGTPGIYSFLVPHQENKGTAVLICPGGGYERLSHLYNGFNLAHWFNANGINAFVLIYRLPHQRDLVVREEAPLQDAERAMRIIRSNAKEWGIDTAKTGVMGTSAGGHLAAMLGTHREDIAAIGDSLDRLSFRPDFMILLSPVITMGPLTHAGSRKNFLGPDTTQAMITKYSNELQVSAYTPPTFMVHAVNDRTVKVQNSLMFYNALIASGINASLHTFPQGGHGIRVNDNPGSTDLWMELLERWLKEMGFVVPLPFN